MAYCNLYMEVQSSPRELVGDQPSIDVDAQKFVNSGRLDGILKRFASCCSTDVERSQLMREIVTVAQQIRVKLSEVDDANHPGADEISSLFDSMDHRPVAMISVFDGKSALMVESPKAVEDGQGNYSFVQGGVFDGEDLLEAAYWELWEEMGIMPEQVEFVSYDGCVDIDFKTGRDKRGWNMGKRYFRLKFNVTGMAGKVHVDPKEISQFLWLDTSNTRSVENVLSRVRGEKAELMRQCLSDES